MREVFKKLESIIRDLRIENNSFLLFQDLFML